MGMGSFANSMRTEFAHTHLHTTRSGVINTKPNPNPNPKA